MRGVGKTTIGSLIARTINCAFFDLDALALSELGASSVRQVFHDHDEETWRSAEAKALAHFFANAQIQSQGDMVLAVGGGAPGNQVCNRILREAKSAGWRIVLLKAQLDELVRRLSVDMADRSALTSLPLADELAQLSATRSAAYNDLADLEVDGNGDPSTVCDCVIALSRG